jgi:hypothetical protein
MAHAGFLNSLNHRTIASQNSWRLLGGAGVDAGVGVGMGVGIGTRNSTSFDGNDSPAELKA